MSLSPETETKILRTLEALNDPHSAEYKEFLAKLQQARIEIEPAIWAIEASEGKAAWQSSTSIANDPSRWHLWPHSNQKPLDQIYITI